MKRIGTAFVGLALVAALATPAFGALAAVGPVNPNNGFPAWYQDATGLALEIGLDPVNSIFDPPIAGNAFSEQIGFGAEAFYFGADSDLPAPYNAVCVLALEAAFANEDPVDGDQFVFARIRIRADISVAGNHVVTHPYGQQAVNVAAAGVRALNVTSDIGGQTPDFARALTGPIGPFLRTATPPAGFIGDPNVPSTVTGSPTGNNFFRIAGPSGTATNNLFTVQGKIFVPAIGGLLPTPIVIDRADMVRTRGTTTVTVIVKSSIGSTVTATLATGGTPLPLVGDAAGNFLGVFRVPSAEVNPATATVSTVQTGITDPVTIPLGLADVVTVRSATFARRTGTLTVTATTSDALNKPILSVDVPNPTTGVPQQPLVRGRLVQKGMTVPPATVTVTSVGGGSRTVPVIIR